MAQRGPTTGELIALGSTIVGSVVGGLVIGVLLDRHFQTTPVFTLIGIGLGMVGAALSLIGLFRRLPKE